MTSVTEGRQTKIDFEPVFISREPDIFTIHERGFLKAIGQSRLNFFGPLTVPAGQNISATLWFQQRKGEFHFESSTYRCTGEFNVWTGQESERTQLPSFSFALSVEEVQALMTGMKNNLLVTPVRPGSEGP